MPKKKDILPHALKATWTVPSEATLGSSVRARGILLEMRARLPKAVRKSLDIDGRVLTLGMPEGETNDFEHASAIVTKALDGIEDLPVIPREIQDILSMTATERHRWLADGRLPSAGTRTVRLQGRARKITFHVFEPRVVVDLLDRGVIDEWRVEDAEARAENRRRAAWNTKQARLLKKSNEARQEPDDGTRPKLEGWEEFGRDGLLR